MQIVGGHLSHLQEHGVRGQVRCVILGNAEEHHVGHHLLTAAEALDWDVRLIDQRRAWSNRRFLDSLCYHLTGKRPPRLGRLGGEILEACTAHRAEFLVATGIAPLTRKVLRALRSMGVMTACYLTDDPWNPANAARFFWSSLPEYDLIATPRQANKADLVGHGCRHVEYVPFGYNPLQHFIEPEASAEESRRFVCDVGIVGGADADRISLARELAAAGFTLGLYGGYWDRCPDLRAFCRGHVHGRDLRLAVRLAGCQVCMVRRANRDGHAMRSFEFPAMGAVPVLEDTPEHRSIFRGPGFEPAFWHDTQTLVTACKRMLQDREAATEVGATASRAVREGNHTYSARLLTLREALLATRGSHN